GRPGPGRTEPKVGHHGENGPGARAHSIDGCDDGLWAGPHGLHDIPGHPRELEESLRRTLRQRTYDLVHITARAEVASSARDDECAYLACSGQCAEQVWQLRVRVERQRVLALRTAESHHADTLRRVPLEMSRRVGARIELWLCAHHALAQAPL